MQNILPLLILVAIVIVYFGLLIKWRYKDRFSSWEIFIRSIFFIYILYILQLNLVNTGWDSVCFMGCQLSQIQPIPFSTLSEFFTVRVPTETSQLMSTDMNAHMRGIFMEHAIGNILLFIPFGFLFFLIVPKNISKKCKIFFIIGAIISKELLQLFLLLGGIYFQIYYRGIADIDDVILNGIGFALGYILYKTYMKTISYFSRK